MKKIVYIVSDINKALAFEWIAESLRLSYDLYFIFLNSGEGQTEQVIKGKGIACYRIHYKNKSDIISAFFKVVKLLLHIKPYLIHTHLFEASLIGLLAGRVLGVKRRIYTRHHATIHHQYFPRAVYYDKIINSMATSIIAVSQSIVDILTEKEGVRSEKVTLIHHGFDLTLFENLEEERVGLIREKYNIQKYQGPIIGAISRYTEWKGIQFIIPAFKSILNNYPNAKLILANAKGDYASRIKEELMQISPDNYREIEFETDIAALYHTFDVFVHVPIDPSCEAFGQPYVEALAAGIPSVFTLSGIAHEFIRHGHNAMVVPYKDHGPIKDAISKLLTSPEIRNRYKGNGKKDVEKNFALSTMIDNLVDFYELQ